LRRDSTGQQGLELLQLRGGHIAFEPEALQPTSNVNRCFLRRADRLDARWPAPPSLPPADGEPRIGSARSDQHDPGKIATIGSCIASTPVPAAGSQADAVFYLTRWQRRAGQSPDAPIAISGHSQNRRIRIV